MKIVWFDLCAISIDYLVNTIVCGGAVLASDAAAFEWDVKLTHLKLQTSFHNSHFGSFTVNIHSHKICWLDISQARKKKFCYHDAFSCKFSSLRKEFSIFCRWKPTPRFSENSLIRIWFFLWICLCFRIFRFKKKFKKNKSLNKECFN